MNVIVKIEEYLPDTQQIIMRICALHTHKIIDEYRTYAIEISDLNMLDHESFMDSLINKVKHLIQQQDENEPILDDNIPFEIDGELDIQNLVGKVIGGKIYNGKSRLLKMRRGEV